MRQSIGNEREENYKNALIAILNNHIENVTGLQEMETDEDIAFEMHAEIRDLKDMKKHIEELGSEGATKKIENRVKRLHEFNVDRLTIDTPEAGYMLKTICDDLPDRYLPIDESGYKAWIACEEKKYLQAAIKPKESGRPSVGL